MDISIPFGKTTLEGNLNFCRSPVEAWIIIDDLNELTSQEKFTNSKETLRAAINLRKP